MFNQIVHICKLRNKLIQCLPDPVLIRKLPNSGHPFFFIQPFFKPVVIPVLWREEIHLPQPQLPALFHYPLLRRPHHPASAPVLTALLGFTGLLVPRLHPLFILPDGVEYDMDMDITAPIVPIRMDGYDRLMPRGKYTDPPFSERHRPVQCDIILRCEADDIVVRLDIFRRIILPKTPVDIDAVGTEVIHITVVSFDPVILPFNVTSLFVQERLICTLIVLTGEVLDCCRVGSVFHRYVFDDGHRLSSSLSIPPIGISATDS